MAGDRDGRGARGGPDDEFDDVVRAGPDSGPGEESDAEPLPDPSEAVGDGRQKYIEVETSDGERHEHGNAYLRQSERVIFVSSEPDFDPDETVTYRKREMARVTVEQHHSSCFITTAVAGEERTLADLRRFRDDALSSSPFGRPLVGLYERLSPPIADTLAARPEGVTARAVRWLVRTCAGLARRRETASPPERAVLSALLIALYVVGVAIAAIGHLAAAVGPGEPTE